MFSKLKAIFKKKPPSKQHRYDLYKQIQTFMLEHPKGLTKNQIYTIFSYYKKWISYYPSAISVPTGRKVLYYITVRTFWSSTDDSNYVQDLLLCLNKINIHFIEFLFGPENFPGGMFEDYAMHFTEFFLTHANSSRLEIDSVRVADVLLKHPHRISHPCEIALDSCSPKVLLAFFRYGALTAGANFYAASYILKIIKQLILLIMGVTLSGAWNNKGASIVQCGKIIIRVCPQLSQSYAFGTHSRTHPSVVSSKARWKWVIDNVLPELESRIFEPMTLKQNCRIKIRGVLHERWMLPDGIGRLPLPKCLQNYLDLLSD